MTDDACRVDVWLWRARFFKTRALAQRFVEAGRLDKPSRAIRPDDILVFAIGPKLVAVQVAALGERRGPAAEAQSLYKPV
jgi:ribosome-associated heat shock protein Hsp15